MVEAPVRVDASCAAPLPLELKDAVRFGPKGGRPDASAEVVATEAAAAGAAATAANMSPPPEEAPSLPCLNSPALAAAAAAKAPRFAGGLGGAIVGGAGGFALCGAGTFALASGSGCETPLSLCGGSAAADAGTTTTGAGAGCTETTPVGNRSTLFVCLLATLPL